MSILFGICKPLGAAVSEQELLHLAQPTMRYAPDGTSLAVTGRMGMGFQPYYTHLRSKLEQSPAHDTHGNLLVFDGRLDNYVDLCRELELNEISSPDSQIILAAHLRWGEGCFSRFIGDWALSLWSAKDQVLYLARDHAGTRSLYFENRNDTLLWSTYLDTLVGDARDAEIDEEYAGCFLAAQPLQDLTPYKGIRAVLPAHYAVFQNKTVSIKPHWSWMKTTTLRYGSNREYDEHFLMLFGQSIDRRDGPGAPIVAQLSGGMDSTSIVTMSDHRRKLRDDSSDLLDTISFYDDSEPAWNEKPYFSAVEKKRGKGGIHLEMSPSDRTFEPHDSLEGLYLLPGADSSAIEQERKIHVATSHKEYRSILSGIGGDEVLGGIPSPHPELADYLAARNLSSLMSRTLEWCLVDKSPFPYLLFDIAKYTYKLYGQPGAQRDSKPPWLSPRLRTACAYRSRNAATLWQRLGLMPSSIGNGLAWWSVMETLPHNYPGILSRPEYRYPYLDRQLVDFLFSVPPDQLVQPGRRRSMMRRALKSIVPEEILERRRKAYQIRGPLSMLQQSHSAIDQLFIGGVLERKGLIDPLRLRSALTITVKGRDIRWRPALMRAIALELWMRGLPQWRDVSQSSTSLQQVLLSDTGAIKIRTDRVAR